jgi:uncharacterized Tic20 family protein
MDPALPNAPFGSAADPVAPVSSTALTVSSEERTWAMGAHLSALIGHIIPFGHILAPLAILIWKKEQMAFVGDQAREALNFQISMTIYGAIAFLLLFVAIGFVLLPLIWVLDIIFTIIAGVKANDGVLYRYPMTLRLVK